jgi:hypothetical protein
MKKGVHVFVITALPGLRVVHAAQNVMDPGCESDEIGILSMESLGRPV